MGVFLQISKYVKYEIELFVFWNNLYILHNKNT